MTAFPQVIQTWNNKTHAWKTDLNLKCSKLLLSLHKDHIFRQSYFKCLSGYFVFLEIIKSSYQRLSLLLFHRQIGSLTNFKNTYLESVINNNNNNNNNLFAPFCTKENKFTNWIKRIYGDWAPEINMGANLVGCPLYKILICKTNNQRYMEEKQ